MLGGKELISLGTDFVPGEYIFYHILGLHILSLLGLQQAFKVASFMPHNNLLNQEGQILKS